MAKDMYEKRNERKKQRENGNQDENPTKTNINWYPGHMLKTKRQIIEDLKLVDIVVEILDARIPISSRNPDIKRIIENKKEIIVLNKSDLAEEKENRKWISKFKENGIIAIETDSSTGKGASDCLKQVEIALQDEMQKAALKGRIKKNIRIMVIGIPNVGKSSFINRICNKKSAVVGNRPGVTKQKQWVRVQNNIELLDTPGVLWPKFQDEKTALNLSYAGTIKDEVLDTEQVAYSLIKYLYKNYKQNLFERYKLTNEAIESIITDSEDINLIIMEEIAKKRGAILPGNNIDYEKISNIILSDFRSGKMGRITLEKV